MVGVKEHRRWRNVRRYFETTNFGPTSYRNFERKTVLTTVKGVKSYDMLVPTVVVKVLNNRGHLSTTCNFCLVDQRFSEKESLKNRYKCNDYFTKFNHPLYPTRSPASTSERTGVHTGHWFNCETECVSGQEEPVYTSEWTWVWTTLGLLVQSSRTVYRRKDCLCFPKQRGH